jgi:peptidoglycan glycosyltransferase
LQGQTTPLCNYANEYCGGAIAQLLPPSCDTGYAQLGAEIGPQKMYDEATAFGFDSQPPIDLPPSPLEVSHFGKPSDYTPPNGALIFLAFSAIGQKYTEATPLQMAMVAATVANGGKEMVPHVMQSIRDSQGNVIEQYQPSVWETPMSAATATAINGLMQSVVTAPNGTANGVFNPADHVAAKTGTAQVGPTNQFTNDWMIAFAPANAPKVAVAVCLPYQPSAGTGAGEAGPIANTMIRAALGQ